MLKLIKHGSFLVLISRICVLTVFLCALLMPLSVQAEINAPVIAVGSEVDFPPYAIVDAKGHASGFSVELLEAVVDAMGLTVNVKTGLWPNVLAAFKSGKYDLLPLVALSPQRADMATYTKPHTVAYDCFFVRRGSRPISSLADAKGKEVIVMTSDAAHEALAHSGLPIRIIETKTIPDAMRLLAAGKHDAVLVPKLLGLLVLRETKLEGVIEAGKPIGDYDRKFAFAVQRGNTELRNKLDQGLAIVHTTGRYDAIYRKWFSGIETQKRHLKTIIVNNYQPYTYMNEKGVPDGFSVEIARAVAKTMDLELEIRADKWDISMKELETGGIDLIPMMASSPERHKLFDFTVPYTIAYDAIFFKKGVKGIRSLNDLNGKTVIVTNNDAAHGYLISSGLSKSMNISLANSLPDALKQLAAGKGDAAIMPKLVGLVVAKNLNLTGIDVSPDIISGYNRPWCFAVRNGNQAMLDRLNQGLNIIKTTGEYDAIYHKWFGALEGTKLQWKTVLKYTATITLVAVIFFVWSMVLRRQVRSRTKHLEMEIAIKMKAKEALRASESLLKEAQRIGKLGSIDWNVNTNDLTLSNEALAIYGFEKESKPALEELVKLVHPEDRERVEKSLQDAVSGRAKHDMEHRIVRHDGKVMHVQATAELFRDADGKPVRLLGTMHDITERKLAELKLIHNVDRLELAQNAARAGIWDWNVITGQLEWTPQMFALFGIDPAKHQASFEAWRGALHPEDKEMAGQRIQQALQQQAKLDSDYRVVWPDGQIHWINATGEGKYDEHSKPVRMIGICIDISERKQAEMMLLEAKEAAERYLNISAELIFTLDTQGTISMMNDSGHKLLGYNPGELHGKNWFDTCLPKEIRPEIWAVFQKLMNGDVANVATYENAVITKSRDVRLLGWHNSLLRNKNGIITGLLSSATDITERKLAEETAQNKNAEMERFTYTVSHDLKSPIVTLKAYLGYLEQDIATGAAERIQQDLGFMNSAADKMSERLGDILELSRIGRVPNVPVRVSFRELVGEATAAVAGHIAKKHVDVHVDTADAVLYGDRPRFAEIWQNLIENAAKYMGDQKTPRIEIGVEHSGADTVFFVRDNGMGIDHRYKDKVFGLFDKLDPKSEGSGLGLALVKRIVELYKGNIWMESEGLGKGTCFKFTLPEAFKTPNKNANTNVE